MNNLHDASAHKRTSINELLNPVGATSPTSLNPSYGHQQLPSLSVALQYAQPPAPHHHAQVPAAQYPPPSQQQSPINAGPQFSLRAANWESPKDEFGPRRAEPESASCRYPSSSMPQQQPQQQQAQQQPHPHSHPHPHPHPHPHAHQPPPQQQQHAAYADSYARHARPAGETPHYSMEVQTWASSHETPSASYGPPMISPVYSDERTGYGPPAPPQHSPYEHELGRAPAAQQHPSYVPNAYMPYPYMHAPPRGPPSQPMMVPAHRVGPTAGQGYYHSPVNMAYAAIPIPHPQLLQHPQKRPSESLDEDSPGAGPKAKKARAPKAKAPDAPGQSRRNYNTKKRADASQAPAQNAQLISHVHVPTSKGKEKPSGSSAPTYGAMRVVAEDSANNPEAAGPLQPELQFARCMSNRYRSEEFPRCVSCTRRWAGDTCRFQNIRFFLKNQNRDIVGISFVESQKPDAPTMNFPNKWNVNLEMEHIRRVKRTVAEALLPILKQELSHLALPEIIRRPRESEVRATCDTCMTSIFSSSWMCRLCGREACAECFEQVKELTTDRIGAPEAEIAALQARREKHAHINPFFLSCTRRNEHQAKDFSPMSRFCKAELTQAIDEMEALLKTPDPDLLPPEKESRDPGLISSPILSRDLALPVVAGSSSALDIVKQPTTPPEPSSFASVSASSASSGSAPGSAPVPSHDTVSFPEVELTEEKFRRVWEKGQPLVVSGLLPKFHIQWTPEYFSAKYGTQSCLILECQTEQNKRVTVGDFFALFGKYEGRRDCWKLKDWPPSTDFKTAFPELYDDFSRAAPVPNYVRRDGVLNIASHFPSNTVSPDLGPKMYNAMASFESHGSKGSTRLHMDMADAINVMTYASPTPDGRPGCAAWDIFRAEDTSKLRKFLRKKFKGQYQHDPIHSQQFYLDSSLRQELYKDYNVFSHRIYQRPGEAVFIPAGCAHQVCNLADCIKVACDFVSPENIERCENLTREFREQNQSMAWKEDVLQLRTMMWFAWLSCTRQEKEMLEG
ncbi:Clavaminate synthase-like protein [Trametes polyzona]|nr:Clavaminate synthase-like protein [Trametes polyzona]